MRAEIKLLHQRTRTTTVYVTHDQVEAMTLGDRVAVMKDGCVQQLGSPDDIYARPANRFVAEFIGSPSMNFIEASRSGAGLVCHQQQLPLDETQSAAISASSGTSFSYGIRPEDIALSDQGCLAGRLSMLEPTGPETYVKVETALGLLTARVPGKVMQRVGDPVMLNWPAAAAHLFDAAKGHRVG
jgi:multiple sugar transport system ATP-binding protein